MKSATPDTFKRRSLRRHVLYVTHVFWIGVVIFTSSLEFHSLEFIYFCENGVPLNLMLGGVRRIAFTVLPMNRLNKTESAVFMSWAHALLLKDPFLVFII